MLKYASSESGTNTPVGRLKGHVIAIDNAANPTMTSAIRARVDTDRLNKQAEEDFHERRRRDARILELVGIGEAAAVGEHD